MKKKFLSTLLLVMIVFSLTSCGETKPTKAQLKELNFEISEPMTEVTDKDTIVQNLIDSGLIKSKKQFKQVFDDLLYYENDDFDLTVGVTKLHANNNEIEKVIKESYVDDITKVAYLKKLKLDGAEGRIGFLEEDSYNGNMIFVLKDGLFYAIEMTMLADNQRTGIAKVLNVFDAPIDGKEFMKSVAESITFNNKGLDQFTVKCKDLSYKLPENVIETKIKDDTYKSNKAYFLYGANTTQITSAYMNATFSTSELKDTSFIPGSNVSVDVKKINGIDVVCTKSKIKKQYDSTIQFCKNNKYYLIEILTENSKKENDKITKKILKTLKIK